jgi:putative intracellular protease/amidase
MEWTSARGDDGPMNAHGKKVLIVVTSHAQLGQGGPPTGLWLEELAVPYRVFTGAGAQVTIASPRGGRPPIDPKSEGASDPEVVAFREDPAAQRALAATLPLRDVRVSEYDAVFVAGGHGVMWDLAVSEEAARSLSEAWRGGKVVAAVCHGPAALAGVTTADGTPAVAGRRVTGFSDAEERAVGLDKVVPFLLEVRLRELGGRYESGPLWQPLAVRDGALVTGQNPASSRATALATLAALDERAPSP